MFDFETTYWWYKGLHHILLDTLRGIGVDSDSNVLDAGCGTGRNLVNVSNEITTRAYGFDVSPEAAPFLSQRGLKKVCLASVNEIPFSSNAFDAVVSVDVLECDAVSPVKAYAEMWRVTKPGGHIILVVPAYDWLMTEEHHRAVHASRRFSKSRVRSLLFNETVTLIKLTHLFAALLPAVALYRLCLPLFKQKNGGPHVSELRPLHPAVNNLLFGIVEIERKLVRMVNLPFGSSILAVVRKGD